HAHARNLVERAVVDLAVVGDADLKAVGEARAPDALAGVLGLGLGQGHADALDAVARGGVDEQGAPAAADVEQSLAGREAQLAADELELALLRGLEALTGVGEVRARVDHAGAEQELVEAV